LVPDENDVERAYGICEPANDYYGIMTRSAWMPILIGERIFEANRVQGMSLLTGAAHTAATPLVG
jgi:hypothetical protein